MATASYGTVLAPSYAHESSNFSQSPVPEFGRLNSDSSPGEPLNSRLITCRCQRMACGWHSRLRTPIDNKSEQ